MKAVMLAAIAAISFTAFAQDPKIRLEKMDDAEYQQYKAASDAREAAAKAYFEASAKYEAARNSIEDKHNARQVASACDKPFRRNVEWKSQYLIVEESDSESNTEGIFTIGCRQNFITITPATTILSGQLQAH